jgi:hypothetical protein
MLDATIFLIWDTADHALLGKDARSISQKKQHEAEGFREKQRVCYENTLFFGISLI